MKFFLALLPTIFLTSYSQLITKWRIMGFSSLQEAKFSLAQRLFFYLLDPYIISAYVFSFLSSIAWLCVVEKFPVSIAFPAYMGILFVIVTIGGSLMLKEAISLQQVLGLTLIIAGVFVTSRV